MLCNEIRDKLFSLRDKEYVDFQRGLIPTAKEVIGVRTPALREYAKELEKRGDISVFLNDLPHAYFDENQLHAFIISLIREYGQCLEETDRFLPYVDNWATCDQLSPKVFARHRPELPENIERWIRSGRTYSIRFGIKMLMEHFLEKDFDRIYPETVAEIRSEEYYVNMMIAWYFATALAKQYEACVPFIEECRLDIRTHNKAIQKALESRRIAPERKEYLRSLKRKPVK